MSRGRMHVLKRRRCVACARGRHRFFGESQPWGGAACELSPKFNESCESSFWPNATRLGLLSEEQALEDFAMVRAAVSRSRSAVASKFGFSGVAEYNSARTGGLPSMGATSMTARV